VLELLAPILNVLIVALDVLQLIVIASIVLSWISVSPSNQFVVLIHGITEPVYSIVRKWTNKIPGPLDWAPMIIILAIILLQSYARLALSKI
jgi:YggT family protein